MRTGVLIALFLLAASCATRPASAPPPEPTAAASPDDGPDVICEGNGVRVLFDRSHPAAFIFEGQAKIVAAPCAGTRIAGANFACDSPGARFFYESASRPAWAALRGSRVELACRPGSGEHCGSSRYCLCHAGDTFVTIDTTSRTAELDHGGAALCATVALEGADTRCTGPEYSLLYDSHDWSRASLIEATGTTALRCLAARADADVAAPGR